jgi:DNA ligase-4
MEAVVENLVLESDNFTPNLFELNGQTQWKWDRTRQDSFQHHTVDVAVRGVQMDMRNVSYYIKRKKGFPAITDEGIVNILLPGDGFGFRLKMSSAKGGDRQNFFKIDSIDIHLQKLKVKFVKSKHKLLFSIIKPFILRAVRPMMQTVLEKAIKDQVNSLDTFLYQVKQEADAAAEQVYEDPTQAPTIYARYAKAMQNRMAQIKEQAERQVVERDFNVAIANERTILPEVKLPGGISNKAAEYREMARMGQEWRSDVFSIGSAGPSSDVPQTPKITRKPHPVPQSANGNGTHALPPMVPGAQVYRGEQDMVL